MSLLTEVWGVDDDAGTSGVPVVADSRRIERRPDDADVVEIAPDMRGLMMDVLSNIPIQKVLVVDTNEESVPQCSVCHELMQIGDYVRKLPCDHKFHQSCIDAWVLQHATCPNCRRHVLSVDDEKTTTTTTPPRRTTNRDASSLRF
jgi:hypothetical protein